MVTSHHKDVKNASLGMIFSILARIYSCPRDEAARKLSKSEESYLKHICYIHGAEALLNLIGFVDTGDALVLIPNDQNWKALRALLFALGGVNFHQQNEVRQFCITHKIVPGAPNTQIPQTASTTQPVQNPQVVL